MHCFSKCMSEMYLRSAISHRFFFLAKNMKIHFDHMILQYRKNASTLLQIVLQIVGLSKSVSMNYFNPANPYVKSFANEDLKFA